METETTYESRGDMVYNTQGIAIVRCVDAEDAESLANELNSKLLSAGFHGVAAEIKKITQ